MKKQDSTTGSLKEGCYSGGDSALNEPKKRTRKSKKQNEKEIMNEYYANNESLKPKSYEKTYEHIQYLSPLEKQNFENKFTQPKNPNQHEYARILRQKTKKIVVATGPAGTGKTLFATEYGVKNFMLGVYEKLVFTRPSVSVDEELGFLPGTLEEKMAPWVRPIYDVLYNFITPKEVTALMEEKIIEIAPLGYMRGRTFKNCWIVADEMQNSTISQMKMLMTRLGENSRLVITGDLEQYDRPNELNGLEDFLNKFKGKRSTSISSFEFELKDIQREDVVKEVLEIYGGEVPSAYCEEDDAATGEDGSS
jgi:phosphate starvation-inducible PhoH-like protein